LSCIQRQLMSAVIKRKDQTCFLAVSIYPGFSILRIIAATNHRRLPHDTYSSKTHLIFGLHFSLMDFLKRYPATIVLLVANTFTFALLYWKVGSFEEPAWTLNLLHQGALFNPLALSAQGYRLVTHMFLHAGVLHLAFNMYALYSVGSVLEQQIGTKKYVIVYFIAGLASALNSLYWSMFTIGVGASGAIFGLFGFSLVVNIFLSRREGLSIRPILINFAVFLGINLLFAKAFNADNAAHMGGLIAGAMLGSTLYVPKLYRSYKAELACIPMLVIIYALLPRYQVSYFDFFQKILSIERAEGRLYSKPYNTDEEFLQAFKNNSLGWDSTLQSLRDIPYLPTALQNDTVKLTHYINLKKEEARFRVTMMENESYIYRDSVDLVQASLREPMALDFPLNMMIEEAMDEEEQTKEPAQQQKLASVRVWYDQQWQELPYGPGSYYRIGTRDSLGRWQGFAQDYYGNNDVQMKGSYEDDLRNGIFIYYSDHKTYESAGRYEKDQRIGKWEAFHKNGRLESEVYYRDRYFLKSLWDSAGVQQVKDGVGKEVKYFANGVVQLEGEYKDGVREGYWFGRHETGDMHFEEHYNHGQLINGRSRNKEGKNFIYDVSAYFPLPVGGYPELRTYLEKATARVRTDTSGTVRVEFRVTPTGLITDIKTKSDLSIELQTRAKEILLNGPRWLPAREYGYIPTDGFAQVEMEFK
jgi:membrane associated rhomboid family serine protease